MTCFRLQNGQSVYSYLTSLGVNYNSFWRRMEMGISFDKSLDEAIKNKGKRFSHPTHFYKGEPIIRLCSDSNRYFRVLRKMRKGMSIEDSLKLEGVI